MPLLTLKVPALVDYQFLKNNFILSDDNLKSTNLKAPIPSYFVTLQGYDAFYDKGIPLDFSEQKILNNTVILDSNHNNSAIIRVRRLSRKSVNKDTVLLTFKGKSLPPKVAIYNASFKVEIYTPPVKICWKCLRYGHISKFCKPQKTFRQCGKLDHEEGSETKVFLL